MDFLKYITFFILKNNLLIHRTNEKKKYKGEKKTTVPYNVKSSVIQAAVVAQNHSVAGAAPNTAASENQLSILLWMREAVNLCCRDRRHCDVDVACAYDDRHRTLASKLAETLTKNRAGETARKMALVAERAALSQKVLSGRQCLLLMRSSSAPRRRRTRRSTRTSRTSAVV